MEWLHTKSVSLFPRGITCFFLGDQMCVLRLRLAREWLDKQGWGRRMQESVAETATLRSWLVSMRVKGRPLKRISRLFYGSAVLTGRGDSASRRTGNPPLQRHRFRSSIVLMRRRHAGCAPAVCAAVPARKGPRSRTSAGESLSSLGRSGAGSQRVEVTLLICGADFTACAQTVVIFFVRRQGRGHAQARKRFPGQNSPWKILTTCWFSLST